MKLDWRPALSRREPYPVTRLRQFLGWLVFLIATAFILYSLVLSAQAPVEKSGTWIPPRLGYVNTNSVNYDHPRVGILLAGNECFLVVGQSTVIVVRVSSETCQGTVTQR